MELVLSLGIPPASKPPSKVEKAVGTAGIGLGIGFNMESGVGLGGGEEEVEKQRMEADERVSTVPPLQLDLSLVPVLRHSSSQLSWAAGTRKNPGNLEASMPRINVNRMLSREQDAASPNSIVSSFETDFSSGEGWENAERASTKPSDEEENGLARKKLRLSKEQSAFLEESFKEQNSLNSQQKLSLAKQLNLRPRQVEVWFQNRRARTKLKQTEVDCEYLKRCCDALREENRRLQKEVADLRALKDSQSFNIQSPATTLSMCPSCDVRRLRDL